MIYITLFLEFFKVGLFSVGGGLATLPFLQDLINKYGWISQRELMNMIAISESTPGPIGINTATFVGNSASGTVWGGIVATLGIIMPSIIIILIIAHYFSKFGDSPIIKSAFKGIRPAVAGVIGAVGIQMAKISLVDIESFNKTGKVLSFFNIKSIIFFGIIFILMRKYKTHPILNIVIGAIVGIIFKF